MSYLWFIHLVGQHFTTTNLQSIVTILFYSLNLSHLASVDLNYSAWCEFSPFVPKMCHAHFVTNQTDSFR